jgi:hypothetical protein
MQEELRWVIRAAVGSYWLVAFVSFDLNPFVDQGDTIFSATNAMLARIWWLFFTVVGYCVSLLIRKVA